MNILKNFSILILLLSISSLANAFLNKKDAMIIKNRLSDIGYKGDLSYIIKNSTVKKSIKRKHSHSAEKILTYGNYRKIFINKSNIFLMKDFYKKNIEILSKAEEKYKVDKKIIVAILLIETKFGKIQGKYSILDAAVSRVVNNPKVSKYFVEQIPAAIKINKIYNSRVLGSYAGAFGITQFMPTSYLAYAVDGNKDGKIDTLNSVDDAIMSVANYFKVHKWDKALKYEDKIKVIKKWNHSKMYAMVAIELTKKI